MEGTSSAAVLFNFLGTLATTWRASCSRRRWILAFMNSSCKTLLRPVNPSLAPNVTLAPSKLQPLRSLKNPRRLEADSLPPACSHGTIRCSSSVTPMAGGTGTLSVPSDVHAEPLKKVFRFLPHVVDKIQNLRSRDFQVHGWCFSFLLGFVDQNLVKEKHPFFLLRRNSNKGYHTSNPKKELLIT